MISDITTFFVIAVYAFTILSTIFMMLLENRSPVKSIAWIIVLLIFPVVGLLFYILVGRSFRKKLVISHRSLKSWQEKVDAITGNPDLEKSFPSTYLNMARMAFTSSNAQLYTNNAIKIYTDGPSLFDDIFKEIENAKQYIHVEYYVFNSDEIGTKFIDALIRKVSEGVKVRLIVDDVGSWMLSRSAVKRMRKAGIEVFCFLKVGLPFLSSKVNYRNHRKILIVDGKVGFTGGMNVADRYVRGTKWGCWRDTHMRITGDGVHGLQRVFISDWYFVSRSYLKEDNLYFPQPTEQYGRTLMQIVASGPDSQWESIMQVFYQSIAQARQSVYIETPYFLPNTEIMNAIQVAALGGVDVRIIMPRRSDASFALRSSCSFIDDMLKAGVKVYFYNPGFIHSKTIVVDGKFSSIGTANMDFRSFDQNFEVNALLYDPDVAELMQKQFFADMNDSSQIEMSVWFKRTKLRKFSESWARLFSPLM